MTHAKPKGFALPIALAIIAIALAISSFALRNIGGEAAPPERVATAEPQVPTTAEPSPTPTKSKPEPLTIKESDILSLEIPNLKIDVKASGATMPRKSERCHASSECLDPPSLKEVAWYGAYSRPSLPRHDTVIILGHSNRYNNVWQTFNNLPAAEKGDKVIVTTKTGVFTYTVTKKALVPYEDVPTSELIFSNAPNRVVLVTCNSRESAGTVVVATLVSAKRR